MDGKAWGIRPAQAGLTAPEIWNFQPARQFQSDLPMPIAPGTGWILFLK